MALAAFTVLVFKALAAFAALLFKVLAAFTALTTKGRVQGLGGPSRRQVSEMFVGAGISRLTVHCLRIASFRTNASRSLALLN